MLVDKELPIIKIPPAPACVIFIFNSYCTPTYKFCIFWYTPLLDKLLDEEFITSLLRKLCEGIVVIPYIPDVFVLLNFFHDAIAGENVKASNAGFVDVVGASYPDKKLIELKNLPSDTYSLNTGKDVVV